MTHTLIYPHTSVHDDSVHLAIGVREQGILLPGDVVGDVLVTPATGADGYAMANNYNAQPRPAVVMVGDGRARVIVERESWDDLLRVQRRLHDD